MAIFTVFMIEMQLYTLKHCLINALFLKMNIRVMNKSWVLLILYRLQIVPAIGQIKRKLKYLYNRAALLITFLTKK